MCGNSYKTNIDYLFVTEEISEDCHNIHYCHHANALFCDLHLLKLSDFIKLKTNIVMYEAYKKL